MSKGNKTHGNREAKKPKKEKPKVAATANFMAGKLPGQDKADKKGK